MVVEGYVEDELNCTMGGKQCLHVHILSLVKMIRRVFRELVVLIAKHFNLTTICH